MRWKGKQRRLKIIYERVGMDFITVRVEKPPPKGGKPLYVNLGVVSLAKLWFEGPKAPISYLGKCVLSDCGTGQERKSRLAKVNKDEKSKKLSKLYRIR